MFKPECLLTGPQVSKVRTGFTPDLEHLELLSDYYPAGPSGIVHRNGTPGEFSRRSPMQEGGMGRDPLPPYLGFGPGRSDLPRVVRV